MTVKRNFRNLGRVNYLGQKMLQPVIHCQSVSQVQVNNSKPK